MELDIFVRHLWQRVIIRRRTRLGDTLVLRGGVLDEFRRHVILLDVRSLAVRVRLFRGNERNDGRRAVRRHQIQLQTIPGVSQLAQLVLLALMLFVFVREIDVVRLRRHLSAAVRLVTSVIGRQRDRGVRARKELADVLALASLELKRTIRAGHEELLVSCNNRANASSSRISKKYICEKRRNLDLVVEFARTGMIAIVVIQWIQIQSRFVHHFFPICNMEQIIVISLRIRNKTFQISRYNLPFGGKGFAPKVLIPEYDVASELAIVSARPSAGNVSFGYSYTQ